MRPGDVPDPVVVAVEEAADEDLVEDGPLEPEGVSPGPERPRGRDGPLRRSVSRRAPPADGGPGQAGVWIRRPRPHATRARATEAARHALVASTRPTGGEQSRPATGRRPRRGRGRRPSIGLERCRRARSASDQVRRSAPPPGPPGSGGTRAASRCAAQLVERSVVDLVVPVPADGCPTARRSPRRSTATVSTIGGRQSPELGQVEHQLEVAPGLARRRGGRPC